MESRLAWSYIIPSVGIFPLSTFCVNISGCLVIGLLAALAEHGDSFSATARVFLFSGFLGGFTTFSAFSYESMFLLRRGMLLISAAYIGLSVVGGLLAVLAGMKAVDLIRLGHH